MKLGVYNAILHDRPSDHGVKVASGLDRSKEMT